MSHQAALVPALEMESVASRCLRLLQKHEPKMDVLQKIGLTPAEVKNLTAPFRPARTRARAEFAVSGRAQTVARHRCHYDTIALAGQAAHEELLILAADLTPVERRNLWIAALYLFFGKYKRGLSIYIKEQTGIGPGSLQTLRRAIDDHHRAGDDFSLRAQAVAKAIDKTLADLAA